MVALVDGIVESLRIGVGFLWTAAWAIIMGLTVTSLVQTFVSKERMADVLGEADIGGVTKATVFGAISSGCSFGAVAIAKGLFKKGAAVVNVLAFIRISRRKPTALAVGGSRHAGYQTSRLRLGDSPTPTQNL